MRVTTWKGDKLVISRRWLPWRRRAKTDGMGDAVDIDIGVPDDPISLVLFAIFALPALIVLALVLSELILLLLLLPIFVLARAIFGMPWTIEVHKPWSRKLIHSEDVKGWGASGERIRALAAEYTKPDRVPAPPTTAAAATSTPPPSLPDLGV